MRFEEVKIIVIGAVQGFGCHFCFRIAEVGGFVVVGDVNEVGLVFLVEEAKGLLGKIVTKKLNVADETETAACVDWAQGELGGLNGLVNNAGILRDGLLVKQDKEGNISKLFCADWQAVIDVNLIGATWMVRDVVTKMVETKTKGVVVNMSSIARYGNRGQSNYAVAKSALAANTKTWAQEFSRFGIRVGAVAPGMVETPMTQGMNQKARNALVAAIPVGRVGVPKNIWLAVKFIIECEYFNARTIDVNGGLAF